MATRMINRKPARKTPADSNVAQNEHAAFLAAEQNPDIVAAANITNGMPADEVKRRILAVVNGEHPL